MKLISRLHKGTNYFGSNDKEIDEAIKRSEIERSTFYKSSVYTYSCYARLLDDNSVELTEYFNNGESKSVTNFKNKDAFWDSKG
jgi:hypothetical protein